MSERRTALLELIEKMENLGQFQDRIDFPSSINQIWQAFLSDVQNFIEIEVCALFLVDEFTNEFVFRYSMPEDTAKLCKKEIELQIECGIFSWIVNRRQPALIPALAFEKTKSIVMLPLSTVKRTLGVVLILTPIRESFITQENMKLMTILTKECSLVMENTLLYKRLRKKQRSLEKANKEIKLLSRIDSLTGCYNRGYMNEVLPREITRALRYKRPLALAMCDIDHFKKVNDTYGHLSGDEVLKEFVRSILELIRAETDWLARYGGEEFLLMLPETQLQNAFSLAERLRKHLARKVIKTEDDSISITASFGVTGFNASNPPHNVTPEALINMADKYLYEAKKKGRNRVISGRFSESD
ncbi:MAG: sensor domain-containing diguanylate cyclase [Desulfobacterales bacterium]|nr:sensor domain-containing diguanylate cyclase [Deltaproteobacteria bacterium]MBT8373916.1 sensor domain-containing diguanylate cyclase [Deltaproteobacteria bacterium]NNK86471.1 sensor domain-containing diguanylate cyclase [Desulfobacterales bacterium]NNL74977.1 sensor domain-containing diguanylate cyclase [Desulfobacterales bacterium]